MHNPSAMSAALKRHDPAYQPHQRPAGLSIDLHELAGHLGYTPDEMAVEWAERAAVHEFDGGMERRAAERAALEDVKRMVR